MPATPADRAVPRLRGLPMVGSLPAFQRDRIGFLRHLSHVCGDMGRLRLGPIDAIFINTAELAHDVLVTHAEHMEKGGRLMRRGNMAHLLGNGLLTSDNALHRRQRKLIAPSFQPRHIVAYAADMAAYGERMAATWADGATVDIAEEMMRLTLWIVGKTLFDADVLGDASVVNEALTSAMRAMHGLRGLRGLLPGPWRAANGEQMRRARARLDTLINGIIAERRRSGDDRGDLLSVLLRAQDDDGSVMTDTQVRDEAMTLFLAGHETTANTLAWTWYLLSQHPTIRARVDAEVAGTLEGRTPTYADLSGLPYTLQVIKESLRLYPPAYMMARAVTTPFTLGGQRVLVGQLILLSPFTLHRQPDSFPDPERFNPDRFAPAAEAQLPRHAFLPFGSGPRSCIGNHFALMEAHILVATLAQRARFDRMGHHQPVTLEPLVTLRPRGGIRMTVRRLSSATPPDPPSAFSQAATAGTRPLSMI